MSVLGTVGIADKGNYNASATYVTGNFVLYEGSTWLALKDNLTGIEPEEGENWKYLARGFGSDNLAQILGMDTSGVLGAVGEEVISQALIDVIADKVMTKLIPYANIANNFLSTDPNTVLSGPMGKSLKEQLDTTNSNLTLISNDLIGKIGTVEFYYETVPIASQAQLDTLINNVYATLNKTGGNLVYKILLSISASGLTIPGGTHLLSGYIYGNSTTYHGAQQILIRSTGIKSRSCAANTWSAWA